VTVSGDGGSGLPAEESSWLEMLLRKHRPAFSTRGQLSERIWGADYVGGHQGPPGRSRQAVCGSKLEEDTVGTRPIWSPVRGFGLQSFES